MIRVTETSQDRRNDHVDVAIRVSTQSNNDGRQSNQTALLAVAICAVDVVVDNVLDNALDSGLISLRAQLLDLTKRTGKK